MNDAAISIDGVTKLFGTHAAVKDLTLTVPRGSTYGFIGPNGSGKTTTLRMILHIIQPDAGKITVLGQTGLRAANDRIGYLPEERGTYRKMTVRRQLLYLGELKGLQGAGLKKAVDSWLERLGLTQWADKKIETLSKGMTQKIQFIGAVLPKPDLVILDEPFSGLDPVNLEVLREAIVGLRKEGTTVIFSTHDMATAEKMCDRIFMIFRGQKVLDGPLAEIQGRYGADTVRLRWAPGVAVRAESLPGVQAVRDLGNVVEIQFSGDSQDLLRAALAQGPIHQFEIVHPSLHDIFVRIAGPDAKEVRRES